MTEKKAYKIVIFSFSKKNGVSIRKAEEYIHELSRFLGEQYQIDLPVSTINGPENYPEVFSKISAILEMNKQNCGFDKLLQMIYITCYPAKYAQGYEEFFNSQSMNALKDVGFQFGQCIKDGERVLVLNDFRIKDDGGILGSNWDELSWVNEFEEKVVWHELLHAFKVDDGSNPKTKENYAWCKNENCLMQYNATLGHGFCQRHKEELIKFLRDHPP